MLLTSGSQQFGFACCESQTAKRLVPFAMLMPIGHCCPPCVYVSRFLSTGLAMGCGTPPGVSTKAVRRVDQGDELVVEARADELGVLGREEVRVEREGLGVGGRAHAQVEHHRVVGRGGVGGVAARRVGEAVGLLERQVGRGEPVVHRVRLPGDGELDVARGHLRGRDVEAERALRRSARAWSAWRRRRCRSRSPSPTALRWSGA
jgi:hypothetical protein